MAFSRDPAYDLDRTPYWLFDPTIPADCAYMSHVFIFGIDPGALPTPPPPPPPPVIGGFNTALFNTVMFSGDRPPFSL